MAFKGIQVIINGIDKLSPVIDSPMKKLEKMGQSFAKIGKAATIGLTLPVLAVGAASVKSAVDFHSGFSKIRMLVPNNISRINELERSVQDLSISTGTSTAELSNGLFGVIQEFGDSSESAKKLEINTKLAAIGFSTLDEAVQFSSVVTKGYGDTSAAAMQKAADLGTKVNNLGVPFTKLSASVGTITPLASMLGISMEELFGTLATVEDITGDVGLASSQLGGVLGSLLKPTKELQSMFEYLGFSSGEAMIKEFGLTKTMKTMVDMADKAGVPLGKLIKRKEGIALASKLAGDNYTDLTNNIKLMNTSVGTLDKSFKSLKSSDPGFQFEVFRRKVEKLTVNIGDKLLPVVSALIDKFTPLIDNITNMQPEVLQLILIVGGLAAAIGPLIMGFSMTALSLVTLYKAFIQIPVALKAVTFGFKALSMVMKGLFLNPVGLIILAIGLLIYNIYLLKKNWGSIVDAFSSKFMILQTLSFFLADIAQSIGHIIAFIPGLGKVAEFFKTAGKGFEIETTERAQGLFGINPGLAKERIGTEGIRPAPITFRTPEIERLIKERKEKSEVLVKFANTPKGMRIEDVKSGDVDINTELGSILSGAY